ncbi:hypothetical protein IU459_23255 [Nocardia amamiensis]|uniref:Uncharacterized protein n=1 Tax=Nocardia amamiensis TaxID=404578 RepID=A0ABS0CWA6_9NOCA|nr:hypothetical protein [Nocardia amamiensis]MBF6300440.1 hypothetical protein [Nocardia amamiensis]
MSSDTTASRQLRDDIQALSEKVAVTVGSDHPAVSTLMRAADELAVTALDNQPRTYGDLTDRE